MIALEKLNIDSPYNTPMESPTPSMSSATELWRKAALERAIICPRTVLFTKIDMLIRLISFYKIDTYTKPVTDWRWNLDCNGRKIGINRQNFTNKSLKIDNLVREQRICKSHICWKYFFNIGTKPSKLLLWSINVEKNNCKRLA